MSAAEAFAPVIARMADLYAEHRAALDCAFTPTADGNASAAAWRRAERATADLDALTEDTAAVIAELMNSLDDGRGDQNASLCLARGIARNLDPAHLNATVHGFLRVLEPDHLAAALGMGAVFLAGRTGPDGINPVALDATARSAAARAWEYLGDVVASNPEGER